MTRDDASLIALRLRDELSWMLDSDQFDWVLEGVKQMNREHGIRPLLGFITAYTMLITENDYIH